MQPSERATTRPDPGTTPAARQWLCCQIGAREHYAIAHGLHRRGLLCGLVTDAWVPPRSLVRLLPGAGLGRLRERYRPELAGARVEAFNGSSLAFELRQRARRRDDYWPTILRRNEWFQDRVLARIERFGGFDSLTRNGVLFAYSYAARRILAAAKRAGWTTVLGQIDPGPVEEEIVLAHQQTVPELKSRSRPAPTQYWRHWREECAVADYIVVNSQWSLEALERTGIESDKLRVVPLAYEPQHDMPRPPRSYPPAFTPARPLRVLFLGSGIVRKGIAEVLAASRLLAGQPMEFHIVGSLGIDVPDRDRRNPKIHWHGTVPRSATDGHYRAADLFLFPTLSDGFGLTQLEARSWGLPLIASRHCGAVAVDGENGRVLPEVSAAAVTAALSWCLENPAALARMSAVASAPDPRFSAQAVISQLVDLTRARR